MTGTYLKTGDAELDALVPRIEGFLAADSLDVVLDGEAIRGYRSPDSRAIWIRDYSDMLRGVRHFEPDVKSVVDHFAATQAANGRVFDFFTTSPTVGGERENWAKYVRVPVESDVEYRFVKAAWLAYQACGDREWIEGRLPHLARALEPTFTHPWRWDAALGLVVRPYTIDTWDFAYTAGRHDWLQFQVDDATFWGTMHGDVSGTFEACRLVAALHREARRYAAAERWEGRAAGLRERLDQHAWNGRFYTHFVKRTPIVIEGVNEAEQLSLSNPMAINRGIASHEQALAILGEYRRRGEASGAFAEWFSIDPPFPGGAFGDEKLVAGAYCNGGILPLVGGELARAAFEHGLEGYGVETLRRYAVLTANGETYLWYHPDGRPSTVEASTSPEAMPTDGWGSSAMLWALLEGLAGIVDRAAGYERVTVSPRWLAAGVEEAEVQVGYAVSGRELGYGFRSRAGKLELELWARHGADVALRVLLPEGETAKALVVGGEGAPFEVRRVEASRYLEVELRVDPGVEVVVTLCEEEGAR